MAFGTLEPDQQDVMNEINMTPLVDVMLVLLIIFIVTIPVMRHSAELDLPKAHSQAIVQKNETIHLNVNQIGQYQLNKKIMSLDELEARLQELATYHPETALHIYGDQRVPYDYVAKAMTTAKRAGIQKVGFVTEAK